MSTFWEDFRQHGRRAYKMHGMAASQPQPVPLSDWPKWALGLRFTRKLHTMLKLPGHDSAAADKGVGDTVARTVGLFGGEAYKAWRKRLGKDCGCAQDQARLNGLYPYVKAPLKEA